jgi:hypothetical protein
MDFEEGYVIHQHYNFMFINYFFKYQHTDLHEIEMKREPSRLKSFKFQAIKKIFLSKHTKVFQSRKYFRIISVRSRNFFKLNQLVILIT